MALSVQQRVKAHWIAIHWGFLFKPRVPVATAGNLAAVEAILFMDNAQAFDFLFNLWGQTAKLGENKLYLFALTKSFLIISLKKVSLH